VVVTANSKEARGAAAQLGVQHIHSIGSTKIGRLWKFKLTEVDEWVRAGGADAHDEPKPRGTT
jgi:hypothetical protein